MKEKLLIIALLISAFCKAQIGGKRMDSLMKIMKDSCWSTMGVGTGTEIAVSPFLFATSSEPDEHKKDTITAIILVSDTSGWRWFTTGSYFYNPIARAEQAHHSINWIRGYIVRNITIEKKGSHYSGDFMWFNNEDKYYYSVNKYLDDEMKPFSKDFIVWQTR